MSKHTLLMNSGHKLFGAFTKGSCLHFLLIKRQFNDRHSLRSFTIQNDDLKGHRNNAVESNFPIGGRMIEENHHVYGGADGEGLKFLTQSLDALEKCYQVANRIGSEKNDESVEVKKVSYLLGRSQVGLSMIRELMRGNGYGIEELISSHELHLGTLPKIGIVVDGKDISLQDASTMKHAVWLWHLERLISFGDLFTREKLIAVFYLIIHYMWNREPTYSLHYMRLFTKEYSQTKKLYTSLFEKSLSNSWSQVLGRVFTENEFDTFQDLDSDLPINLKSMYNIFSAFVSFADSEKIPVDVYLKVLDQEQEKNPLNPYIPFMKVMMEDQFGEIETVMKILEQSTTPNQNMQDKRMTFNEIFSNNNQENIERIKDFKFFPVLYWKAFSIVNDPSKEREFSISVKQLEQYSGMPSHSKLLTIKMIDEYNHGNYERVLEIFNFIEQYFLSQTKLDDAYCSTYYTCQALQKLGRIEEAKQLIQKKVSRYAALDSSFKELMFQFK